MALEFSICEVRWERIVRSLDPAHPRDVPTCFPVALAFSTE